MNAFSSAFALVAVLARIQCAAAADTTDSGKRELSNRLIDGFSAFHALGGANYELTKSVLSKVQNGALETLMAIPIHLDQPTLSNNNAVFRGYHPSSLPSFRSTFRRDKAFPRGGGGYRGVKSLPFPVVGGGYRGVPPGRSQIPQGVLPHDERPIRDGRFNEGSAKTREILVDFPEVIREDKVFPPVKPSEAAVRPIELNKPAMELVLEFKPIAPAKKPRQPLVPVTEDGPPSEDFISKLEADLVADLTPQQLEELSSQAIDPRTNNSKKTSRNKIIFPGRFA